jgi:cold shock CspA family protein
MTGVVKFYNSERGIGKILGEDNIMYFAHYSKVVGRSYKILYVGEEVHFDIFKTKDKTKNDNAINIRPLDLEMENIVVDHNPFYPDRPINEPRKFAGRRSQIIEAINALENNHNILITGERGIGKSSLANQLLYLSQGDNYLLEKFKIDIMHPIEYAPVVIKLKKDSRIQDMSSKIILEYQRKYDIVREKTEGNIDYTNYKLDVHKIDEDKILDLFNYDIIKIHDVLGYRNGLLIFIDELENISSDNGLALFIKNTTEYFVTENRNINFILSGIPCELSKLFLEHKSFYRLFTPITLKELSTIETDELISTYFEQQRKHILDQTRQKMIALSKGLPINIQLLGFYTYQLDQDSRLDNEDLSNAIDYIISNIKREEYAKRHESIGYGLTENILKFICNSENERKTIEMETVARVFYANNENDIADALKIIEANELITKYSKGKYFIKDFLFHQYLNKYYKRYQS